MKARRKRLLWISGMRRHRFRGCSGIKDGEPVAFVPKFFQILPRSFCTFLPQRGGGIELLSNAPLEPIEYLFTAARSIASLLLGTASPPEQSCSESTDGILL